MDKTRVGTEESTRAVNQRCSVNNVFWKIHWKISVLESLFNEVSGFETCNCIKKVTPAKIFFCEFCEAFKNIYFLEYLQKAASELGILDVDFPFFIPFRGGGRLQKLFENNHQG